MVNSNQSIPTVRQTHGAHSEYNNQHAAEALPASAQGQMLDTRRVESELTPRLCSVLQDREMAMPSDSNILSQGGIDERSSAEAKAEIDTLLSASYRDQASQPAVFAVDVGGTKISYGLFPLTAEGAIQAGAIYQQQIDTTRGRGAIALALQNCFKDAILQASAKGFHVLPVISAGTPGRFIGPNQDIIAPKSAANLEAEPGEFDDLSLADFLSQSFPEYVSVKVKNDALSQMSAGLSNLLQQKDVRPLLLNQKVAYIGPGTGLGGGFCTVDAQGNAEYFSDGHIIDNPIKDRHGKIQGAEDVFSGRAFGELTGKTAKAVNSDPELFAAHLEDVKLMGQYLGQIIQGIHQGDLEKVNPDARWPQADIDKATGTQVFLIGGSMGTRGEMGRLIQKTAQEALSRAGIGNIKIIPIPDAQDAALFGTAEFLTHDELEQAGNFVKQQR